MRSDLGNGLAAWRALLVACLSLICPLWLEAQMVDLNGNGMSDIWELTYGASGLSPGGDADGDGASNLQESIAGTDPFDPNSAPRVSVTTTNGTNLVISIAGALGKQYQLQSIQPSGSGPRTNWVTEAGFVLRSGTIAAFVSPVIATPKFYRIAISDVDTDGDGVNDWEEYKLGLDPTNPTSNGQLDANGQLLTDYAYVTGRLASQNVITISATDPTANQPDPGEPALNLGVVTITRGGFPLNAITVNVAPAGPGVGLAVEGTDFAPVPRSLYFPVGTSSRTITVMPLANTNLAAPVLATVNLLAGSGYTLGTANRASVVIYPSATTAGTGLMAQYYTNSSPTYSSSANFNPLNLVMTRVDPTVDFVWGTGSSPITNSGYYTVRWTGQIQPQYSETYYFEGNSDDGLRLWVNNQLVIDRWSTGAADTTSTISLQAGVKYNIQLDYFQGGGNAFSHLSWYSPSQARQIIPSNRLYPAAPAPAQVTSPLTAVAFLGQPFAFTVTGANSASAFTANGLPLGLTLNSGTGLISGIPTLAGDYQVTLTASNTVGIGASVLDIQVIDTGSSVVREVWLGAPGVNISDIPLSTPATSTNTLGALEGVTNFGDNYAERVRGFFTAPVTGDYYFWIAGSDSAELWISNDSEPANKVRRAFVVPGGTAPRQWNLQPNQISGWLTLLAGQRYYLEVLHKAGVGTNDNWSVGWIQDPTGTNTVPTGVVPGYLLGRYYAPPPSANPGTLYSANMLAASGVTGTPVGSATVRLSADGTRAILNFSLSGLSSPITGEHVVSDPYLNSPSQILFDISASYPQPDGSYVWPIVASGPLSASDVLEILNENKAYITILTANHPDGELNGHFTLANGTQTFTPPPPPPAWTDDSSDPSAAARFLVQSSFGPSPSDIAAVQAVGYDGWINNQFSLPATHHLPFVLANKSADPTQPYPSTLIFNAWWQQSMTAPDQLRQRVAFALSEIMVVSDQGVLNNNARAVSAYYDTLLDNAFGNYRSLLEAVTLSPAMGLFLNMQGNAKGSIISGIHANENYAREIQQLFSIGLNRLWPDGTLVMDSQGNLVPTYNQNVIMGFAAVFTGWNYYQAYQANGRLPTNFSPSPNYINPMVLVPTYHDLGTKLVLDNVMLPQAWGSQANSSSTNFDTYCSQDLELALNSIFNNQNVGPFICRQLIQRLVTSNPSRDYLYRVVQAFNNNGSGVRGDMQAVIKAILLDYEARSPALTTQPTFGKQREPLLRATAAGRAFLAAPVGGGYGQSGTQLITITTTNAHRLNTSDIVWLTFTDTSGQPAPTTQGYSITVNGPNSFTVNSPGASTCTYTQAANILVTNQFTSNVDATNAITVTLSGHGLIPGDPVYLQFTTGNAISGPYQVVWTNSNNTMFAVETADPSTNSGNGLRPKLNAGGYTQSATNITINNVGPHGLNVGDQVLIKFTSGTAVSGQYQVASVPDATHFAVTTSRSASQSQNSLSVYPLVPPPFNRSGSVLVAESTFHMNTTDTVIEQTPLHSPTVFNFFYPDYKFPGPLASAALTTPEFQLTSDTTVAVQMNFFEGGLLNNTGNTNGISSFVNGNGAIGLDLGPWMTPAYTANSGIPNLVDALSSLLMGGPLSSGPRSAIINYVANTSNFPMSAPASASQMRDRVRGVLHLLFTSPEFTIQR